MASQDQFPQGGDLSDMAATGTSVPSDSAKPDLLPSVPRPDQKAEDPAYHNQLLNAADQQGAVGNDTDVPRSSRDVGVTGEVITGTGDQLPPGVESKRLDDGTGPGAGPYAKGHDRYGKHIKQKESDLERLAGDGAEVDAPPGEEELSQDEIRDRRGL